MGDGLGLLLRLRVFRPPKIMAGLGSLRCAADGLGGRFLDDGVPGATFMAGRPPPRSGDALGLAGFLGGGPSRKYGSMLSCGGGRDNFPLTCSGEGCEKLACRWICGGAGRGLAGGPWEGTFRAHPVGVVKLLVTGGGLRP